MIPEGTKPEQVTPQQVREVIEQVARYKVHASLSNNTVGKGIGYAGTTISQVLSGKYAGDVRQIVIDLDAWLEQRQKVDATPRTTDYVPTQVALEIKTVADTAIVLKTIGLVYGPTTSGVGKTMALEAIARETPGSIMITIEKVSASVSGLLTSIAEQLRIGTGPNQQMMFARIKEKFRNSGRLLLVDQIHNLCHAKNDRPFFVLCDLIDATGAPQLWCGTSDIVAYLDNGERKGRETLAQIRRRIGIARDLMERTRPGAGGGGEPLYTIDEIRKIFGRGKMRLASDAAQYLCKLANHPDSGALGTCRNIVDMAVLMNESGRGETVLTQQMLRGAHRLLCSDGRFDLIEHKIEESQPTLKMKVG